jgi:hypothetical protein
VGHGHNASLLSSLYGLGHSLWDKLGDWTLHPGDSSIHFLGGVSSLYDLAHPSHSSPDGPSLAPHELEHAFDPSVVSYELGHAFDPSVVSQELGHAFDPSVVSHILDHAFDPSVVPHNLGHDFDPSVATSHDAGDSQTEYDAGHVASHQDLANADYHAGEAAPDAGHAEYDPGTHH